MNYVKSGTLELGTVIECCKRVEGIEIGVGMGYNSNSLLRLSPQGCKVTCHGVDDCQGPMCHVRMSQRVT